MENDERFAHIATDPTFRKRGRKKKVKLDKRFEGALTDERFSVSSGPVDKRGGKTKKKAPGEELKPFYELEQPLDEAEKARAAELDARARGEVEGSSSSDEASSGDESDELESVDDEAWDEGLPPTHELKEGGVETARLAVTDQEWKHCRARDLLVMLQSLCPPGGRCREVKIYASSYGAQEMAREERFGPEGIWEAGGEEDSDGDEASGGGDDAGEESGSGDDSASEEEERAPEGFDAEKLRRYELRKLRRFFAVATFDSAATADACYAAGDGVEVEATSVPLSLSFVPEDQGFEALEVTDAADGAGDYQPPKAYCLAARQQTKVHCTFDDDDGAARKEAFERMAADPENAPTEYLADSDDEEDAPDASKLRGLLGLEDAAPATNEGFDDDFFGAEEGDVGKEDIEFTADAFGDAEPEAETPWEARERRRREKKAARKQKLKAKEEEPAEAKPRPKQAAAEDEDPRDFDAKKLARTEKLAGKTKLKGKRKRERARLL
eukprot:CAMPEP_0119270722 /NCGR_PEP_ID=MMETSP1329-20130426/7612_1 /TAXON_ID=114041 /ORGANISM="Genus nov. species nov., Strain RCC1024" /LENGTH=497 /DNA_ID=CAMNT_0007270753 /DNA_START=168 /DNA_END=1658 /DNA_ORIENTATION=-